MTRSYNRDLRVDVTLFVCWYQMVLHWWKWMSHEAIICWNSFSKRVCKSLSDFLQICFLEFAVISFQNSDNEDPHVGWNNILKIYSTVTVFFEYEARSDTSSHIVCDVSTLHICISAANQLSVFVKTGRLNFMKYEINM